MLVVDGVETGYGRKLVLDGISLTVGQGEAIALVGHNGAGKTTLLQAVFGLQPLWKGRITLAGEPRGEAGRAHRAEAGHDLALIPSERFVFPDLTVEDNLRLSARGLDRALRETRIAASYETYPILAERRRQLAGTMSGGQQRMVSLAMALMTGPRLLMLDEPSLGLSPVMAEQLMKRVRGLVEAGLSVILVEQNIPAALSVADRIYVMRSGRIILEEPSPDFLARGRDSWWKLF